MPNTPDGNYWGRDTNGTNEISWFKNLSGEWVQLGYGDYTDYPGDWNLKAHLYNDDGVYIEKTLVSEIVAYNYPNPCVEYTNIYFENPQNGNVKIIITDINGKLISTIQNSILQEGSYLINFNTQSLSTGTYIYSIFTNDIVLTKKFIKK